MPKPQKIPGRTVSQGRYSAFIPSPLSPPLDWSPHILRLLSDADRLNGGFPPHAADIFTDSGHSEPLRLRFCNSLQLEARIGIDQGNPKNTSEIPNVCGLFNHLPPNQYHPRPPTNTDDSTDGFLTSRGASRTGCLLQEPWPG
jgi:hypothetical protein